MIWLFCQQKASFAAWIGWTKLKFPVDQRSTLHIPQKQMILNVPHIYKLSNWQIHIPNQQLNEQFADIVVMPQFVIISLICNSCPNL